jgi:hypothetical protein
MQTRIEKYFRDSFFRASPFRKSVIEFFSRTPNQSHASVETIPINDSAGANENCFGLLQLRWCLWQYVVDN